jgi:hypothetical protein
MLTQQKAIELVIAAIRRMLGPQAKAGRRVLATTLLIDAGVTSEAQRRKLVELLLEALRVHGMEIKARLTVQRGFSVDELPRLLLMANIVERKSQGSMPVAADRPARREIVSSKLGAVRRGVTPGRAVSTSLDWGLRAVGAAVGGSTRSDGLIGLREIFNRTGGEAAKLEFSEEPAEARAGKKVAAAKKTRKRVSAKTASSSTPAKAAGKRTTAETVTVRATPQMEFDGEPSRGERYPLKIYLDQGPAAAGAVVQLRCRATCVRAASICGWTAPATLSWKAWAATPILRST